jgi:hypothetical protein
MSIIMCVASINTQFNKLFNDFFDSLWWQELKSLKLYKKSTDIVFIGI